MLGPLSRLGTERLGVPAAAWARPSERRGAGQAPPVFGSSPTSGCQSQEAQPAAGWLARLCPAAAALPQGPGTRGGEPDVRATACVWEGGGEAHRPALWAGIWFHHLTPAQRAPGLAGVAPHLCTGWTRPTLAASLLRTYHVLGSARNLEKQRLLCPLYK